MKIPRTQVIPVGGLLFGGLLCLVTIIIAIICIEAGANPGQLEDVYIAKFNMTHFGQDLIPKLKDKVTSNASIVEGWASINSDSSSSKVRRNILHPSPTELDKRLSVGDITGAVGSAASAVTSAASAATSAAGEAADKAGDIVSSAGDAVGDAFDKLSDFAKEIMDKVVDKLDAILDDLMGDIASQLGIPDYFSIHLKDVCFIEDTGANSTNGNLTCSKAAIGYGLNLTGYLDKQLTIASYKVPLRDFLGQDVEDKFQSASHAISIFVKALCVFYIIGAAAAAGSLLLCLAVSFLVVKTEVPTTKTGLLIFAGLGFAGTSTLFLVIGSVCTTMVAKVANDKLGSVRTTLNIQIDRGERFVGLTWTMVVAMGLTTLIWTGVWWKMLRSRRGRQEKESGKDYEMDERYQEGQ